MIGFPRETVTVLVLTTSVLPVWFLISKPHSESLPVTKSLLFNVKQNNTPYKSSKDRKGVKVVSQALNWEFKSAPNHVLNERIDISTTKIKM